MTRPSWDATWLQVAAVVAQRSRCSRAQVGAVIVDSTNRIVATGFNGPPRDFRPDPFGDGQGPLELADPCDGSANPTAPFCVRGRFGSTAETHLSYEDCPSLHGEANSLLFCDRRLLEGGTIYVSGQVCYACAKLIANSGLARVVMASEATDRSYRSPELALNLLTASGLEVLIL